MKKIFLAAVLMAITTALFAHTDPVVNEKVLQAFKKTFHDAKEVTWYDSDEGYEVYFRCDNVRSRVWYDTEGNILRSYRYYGEQKLHPIVLGKIKTKYPGKTIAGVTEVSNREGIYYFVKLHDSKYWLTVKADANANLELYEKFEKADAVKKAPKS